MKCSHKDWKEKLMVMCFYIDYIKRLRMKCFNKDMIRKGDAGVLS